MIVHYASSIVPNFGVAKSVHQNSNLQLQSIFKIGRWSIIYGLYSKSFFAWSTLASTQKEVKIIVGTVVNQYQNRCTKNRLHGLSMSLGLQVQQCVRSCCSSLLQKCSMIFAFFLTASKQHEHIRVKELSILN